MAGIRRERISPFYMVSMVDKFLYENNFSNTRSIFRNEASFLFSNPSISNQVENNLLSLEEIMDEYILLKSEKAVVDQQRDMVMQEKNRIRMLLQGIYGAVNIYRASERPLNVAGVSTLTKPIAVMQNTYNAPSLVNTNVNIQNFPTNMISNVSDKKRKDNETLNGPTVAKRPRGRPPSKKNNVLDQNTEALSSKDSSCPKQMAYEGSTHSIAPIETSSKVSSCPRQIAYEGSIHSIAPIEASSKDSSCPRQMASEGSIHSIVPIEACTDKEKEDDICGSIDFSDFDALSSDVILSYIPQENNLSPRSNSLYK